MGSKVGSQASPYCGADQPESADPDDVCNVYDGRIVFYGHDPDADTAHPAPDSTFSAALAWWTWDAT